MSKRSMLRFAWNITGIIPQSACYLNLVSNAFDITDITMLTSTSCFSLWVRSKNFARTMTAIMTACRYWCNMTHQYLPSPKRIRILSALVFRPGPYYTTHKSMTKNINPWLTVNISGSIFLTSKVSFTDQKLGYRVIVITVICSHVHVWRLRKCSHSNQCSLKIYTCVKSIKC